MRKVHYKSPINIGFLLALACLPVLALAQGLSSLPAVTDRITQQQADRAQAQAADRAQQQAANQAQQLIDKVQQHTSDQVQARQESSVQSQVADRVDSQVERVQTQAASRAQSAVEQAQSQAAERSQTATEKVQGKLERVQQHAGQVQNAAATNVAGAQADTGNNAAGTALQQNVRNSNGTTAFVEVTVAPGVRAVAFEWVMLVTPAQRQQLADQASPLLQFLTESRPYALTGGEMLTFSVPPDLDANDGVLALVAPDLRGQLDRNHVYVTQSSDHTPSTRLPLPFTAVCDAPVTIGMIDSAIDTTHPAFASFTRAPGRLQTRNFVDHDLVAATAHGTTVASMLVGKHESIDAPGVVHPLLPRATLYNAAVFHEEDNAQQGATVTRLLAALDWLINDPKVRVINMSLAGPPNRLLEQVVKVARQRGKLIVAAVGNEGPNGPARYPAAYADVIGVTAVDRDGVVFRWANQGPQVAFAALGVAVPAAADKHTFAPASGTSVAAPVVTAFLACALQQQADPAAALLRLQKQAIDLGKPGRDPVFGQGLLHPGMHPAFH